ncbi:hypothetical protein BSKO_13923 [Bryopsis sp. KO-2023]|nr:hypothetical protein BSKO_13923 [Bryopsis sp. KO-2023]
MNTSLLLSRPAYAPFHSRRCGKSERPNCPHQIRRPRCAAQPEGRISETESSTQVSELGAWASAPLGALGVLLAFPPQALSAPVQAQLYTLAALDAQTASALSTFLSPTLAVGQVLMIVRIVLTWYPELDTEKFPWVIAFAPTEPVLAPTRKVVPPAFGVDVSPIIWVGLFSFVNEVLLGPQGILNLIQRKA